MSRGTPQRRKRPGNPGSPTRLVPRDPILKEIEACLRTTGMLPTQFGLRAVNDAMLVLELRRGREPRRATRERIRACIAELMAEARQ